jgi:hypothetical protein
MRQLADSRRLFRLIDQIVALAWIVRQIVERPFKALMTSVDRIRK